VSLPCPHFSSSNVGDYVSLSPDANVLIGVRDDHRSCV